MPWYGRKLLNKALTLFGTVKKHCDSTFKIGSYLRFSTDQYDQLDLMEKKKKRKKIQDQQFLTFEYYSDWRPSLFRSLCKKTTQK